MRDLGQSILFKTNLYFCMMEAAASCFNIMTLKANRNRNDIVVVVG